MKMQPETPISNYIADKVAKFGETWKSSNTQLAELQKQVQELKEEIAKREKTKKGLADHMTIAKLKQTVATIEETL